MRWVAGLGWNAEGLDGFGIGTRKVERSGIGSSALLHFAHVLAGMSWVDHDANHRQDAGASRCWVLISDTSKVQVTPK